MWVSQSHLQVHEHGYVENEGEHGDRDDVAGEVPPGRGGADVDAVLVRGADGEVALEGEGHDEQHRGAHGHVREDVEVRLHGVQHNCRIENNKKVSWYN